MTLVVGGICRYTLNGEVSDRPWANILDMHIASSGDPGYSRESAIFDTAGNIINSWAEHMAPLLGKGTFLESVSWVDLDTADGSTGSRVSTSEHNLPIEGGGATLLSPGSVAILVTKQVSSSRGRRNGRMYVAGVVDGLTNGNTVEPTVIPTWQNAMDAYLAELNDVSFESSYTRDLSVVHTTGAAPTTGTYSHVDSLVVSNRPATQRRRLRG